MTTTNRWGARSVVKGDDFSITELRGGTHLVLEKGIPTPGDAPFDLMMEDLQASHARFLDAGLNVSEIIPGQPLRFSCSPTWTAIAPSSSTAT